MNVLKLIGNINVALNSSRWHRDLFIAVISDILGIVFVIISPVQVGVDVATAILTFVVLGFRWGPLGALVIETIPAIQVFPAWTLVVLALASAENNKSKKGKRTN
jgi:hypothetical protein